VSHGGCNNNSNDNNNQDDLWCCHHASSIVRVHRVYLVNADSIARWLPPLGPSQLPSTSAIAFLLLLSPKSDISFTVSWRKAESSWALQERCSSLCLPETAYRNGCRNAHHCQWRDSNLDSLTPQPGWPLLRPTKQVGVNNLPKGVRVMPDSVQLGIQSHDH